MNRSVAVLVTGIVLFVVLVGGAWGQEITAKLQPSGLIVVSKGGMELARIDLNAHGPGWKNAPQETATAQNADTPPGTGRKLTGTLPVPGTEGALTFTESVTPTGQGLKLEYDVGVTKAIKLNGLQVSVMLPVAQYGGKEIVVTHPEQEVRTATLPAEAPGDNAQVFGGEGARVEVAKGTPEAITLEVQAPTDLLIQDLRKWEHPIYEIRFPAIMEDGGREIAAEDKFHLAVTVTFAEALKLE